MKKPEFLTAAEAAQWIESGKTVATIGMTLISASESILKAIEQRFLDSGAPNNLTLVHSCGQSDRDRGIQHFAHEGMMTRIIGGHWGLQPRIMDMISDNKLLAYCFPQGQFAQLYRSMAGGEPGKISKVGLGTFIDPRLGGGKMNEITQPEPHLVDVVEIDGEEYIRYKPIPLDYVIIRGTNVDEIGNLSTEEECMQLEVWAAVMACKRFGGKVIAQAKRKVRKGSIHPKRVTIPGVFIDAVVICDNPEEDHRMTHSFYENFAYCGDIMEPDVPPMPLVNNLRKFIGRRASMEIRRNNVLNVGTGIPNDTIGSIIGEEGVGDEVTLTVESGIYGGLPLGGVDFGIAKNCYALVRHDDQFDFYNGAGVDVTFMGAGEIDALGNVNATKLGPRPTGAGGFIDITTNAKHVVFCSAFTGRGLHVSFDNGQVSITNEGSIQKCVDKVQQISYNGEIARKKGQKMTFVTERCVFSLREEGLVLTEIAPGVDMQRDILDQMGFVPIIAEDLKVMPASLYQSGAFGLKDMLDGIV